MFTSTAIKKLTTITAGAVLIALKIGGSAQAVVLTFDDVFGDNIAAIPDGYGGLNWENFSYTNSASNPAYEGAGYQNGTESGNYVGFNRYGDPGIVKSSSVFNFSSAYLTAAWNNSLSITVEGLTNGTQRYSNTVVLNTNDSTLFDFNYLGIDELRFNSAGGVNAGFKDSRGREGAQFVVDNFTFRQTPTLVTDATTPDADSITPITDATTPTPIPYEPSSALGLLTLGAFGTGAMLKRKLQEKAKAKNLIYSDLQVEKLTQSSQVVDAKVKNLENA